MDLQLGLQSAWWLRTVQVAEYRSSKKKLYSPPSFQRLVLICEWARQQFSYFKTKISECKNQESYFLQSN